MKAKKVLAMLMASAMIMGTTVTAFAYEIPITNDNAVNATYSYLQVIEPATNKLSGWKFVNDTIAEYYTDAFEITNAEESSIPTDAEQQEAIWMLILKETPNVNLPEDFSGIQAATDAQIATALASIQNSSLKMDGTGVTDVDVNEAGVYYILGNETNYVYSPMAAYVSFTYTAGGEAGELTSEGVTAKKTPNWAEKTGDHEEGENPDKVTEIERTETYVVESTVPYFAENEINRVYKMEDTITGGEYVTEQLEGGDKIQLTVIIGDNTSQPLYFLGTVTDNGDGSQSFVANLSELVQDNTYQNQKIEISYQAVVKDTVVKNDVKFGDAETDDKFGDNSEILYTGNIVITKYAEDKTENTVADNQTLEGATFKVYKDAPEDKKLFATFSTAVNEEGMNVYTFTGWTETESDTATEVTTGTAGTAKVEGLDLGDYHVIETVAPNGYSLNNEVKDVTLELADGETEANAEVSTETYMIDTKLSELPSTGGIGTTIFTIGGCVIMVTAAGLYFATRKKEQK